MKIFYILSILFLLPTTYAQNSFDIREGVITYISSQNVYIKFENTSDIKVNDTLFTKDADILSPAVQVKFISSRSAAGELLNNKDLKVADKLYIKIQISKEEPIVILSDSTKQITAPFQPDVPESSKKDQIFELRPAYSGRFSIQSYSNFSNGNSRFDTQRWRYTLSFKAENISGSAISLSSYFNFSYRASEWGRIKNNLTQNLRIYDLALNYKIDNYSLWFGRYLNRKISSISSIDGIQVEGNYSNYFAGLVAGSRPNFSDMGFNLKLFEFGGYFGRSDTVAKGIMENTFAVFNQTNNLKTDRRFFYFQHNNSILPRTFIFLSTEADLYKKVKGEGKNEVTLTGVFLSLRYSPIQLLSLNLSYDARKNVIYYETFKNFIDSLIENETRQGLRGSINIRPFNFVNIGLSGGYRFQKSDIKPSRNFSGYLSYSSVPLVELSSTLSYNKIISSYLDGNIWGVRVSKTFFQNVDAAINFRNTEYSYAFSNQKQNQNSISIDLSSKIFQFLYWTISYEGIFEKQNTNGRLLMDLTTRL